MTENTTKVDLKEIKITDTVAKFNLMDEKDQMFIVGYMAGIQATKENKIAS